MDEKKNKKKIELILYFKWLLFDLHENSPICSAFNSPCKMGSF